MLGTPPASTRTPRPTYRRRPSHGPAASTFVALATTLPAWYSPRSSAAMSEGSTPWRSAASASATASASSLSVGASRASTASPAARRSTPRPSQGPPLRNTGRLPAFRDGAPPRTAAIPDSWCDARRLPAPRCSRTRECGWRRWHPRRTRPPQAAGAHGRRSRQPGRDGGILHADGDDQPPPNFTSAQVNGTGCSPLFCWHRSRAPPGQTSRRTPRRATWPAHRATADRRRPRR